MEKDPTPKESTSRRQFTKAAVTAAIAAPIAAVLASCTRQPSVNNPPREATPSATPVPTDQHPLEGDGSPITVGGGGGKRDKDKPEKPNVSCEFKEDADHYAEEGNTGSKKKFKNKKGWKIRTFKIRSNDVWTDYSDKLPPTGGAVITIECEGGDQTTVTIKGDELGIEMDTSTYKMVSPGYYENPNAAQYIKRVRLTVPGSFPVNEYFTAANQCKVCVDFVKPDKSMCGRPTPTPTP